MRTIKKMAQFSVYLCNAADLATPTPCHDTQTMSQYSVIQSYGIMWHSTYSGCFSLCCYWWGYLLKKKVRVVTDRRDNMSLLVDKKILLWGTRRSVRCTVCYQDGSHRPSIIIVRRRRRRRRRRVVALRCTVPPVVCLDPVNHWYCQYAIRIPTLLVLGLVISNIHQHTVGCSDIGGTINKGLTNIHLLF